MAFVLRVKGDDSEESRFVFDGTEARLGRTADNDIVVKDTEASRNHARVYERNGICFLEDLQSANGTRHNGVLVTEPMALKSGDELSIGVITFIFEQAVEPQERREAGWVSGGEVQEANSATEVPLEAEVPSAQGTVVSAVSAPQEDTAHGPEQGLAVVAPVEKGADSVVAPAEHFPPTRVDRGSRDTPTGQPPPLPSRVEVAEKKRPMPQPELSKGTGSLPAGEPSSGGTSAGAVTRFQRLSDSTRLALGGLITMIVIASILIAAYWAVQNDAARNKPREPMVLLSTGDTLVQSFGLGPGVHWPRPDMKLLSFTIEGKGPVMVVVHLQARDLADKEVSVSLNGAALAWLPADSAAAATREIEVALAPRELKLGEPNQLIFDNVKNPPGADPWRIWNVWLEVVPIPAVTPDALIEEADADFRQGEDAFELKDVAVGNLFKAFTSYRRGWLKLESLDHRPAELHEMLQARLDTVRPLLDAACNAMVLEVQGHLNASAPARARASVEEILRRFPTREHRCHDIAVQYQQDLSGL